MRKRLFAILLTVAIVALCGCGKSYSESDIENARRQGYNEGYDDGYSHGTEDQREEDYEDLLIDGCSIRTIVDIVRDEYGITPSEAFSIIDAYEFDSDHGGYTWNEYQNAILAMYCTVSVFPQDY